MIYALDASGSLCGAPLERMIDFVKARGDATKVLFFDTVVIAAIDPSDIDKYRDINGGGTLIEPVFDWVRDNAPGEKLSVLSDGMYHYDESARFDDVEAILYLTEPLQDYAYKYIKPCFTKMVEM